MADMTRSTSSAEGFRPTDEQIEAVERLLKMYDEAVVGWDAGDESFAYFLGPRNKRVSKPGYESPESAAKGLLRGRAIAALLHVHEVCS